MLESIWTYVYWAVFIAIGIAAVEVVVQALIFSPLETYQRHQRGHSKIRPPRSVF